LLVGQGLASLDFLVPSQQGQLWGSLLAGGD
jgi:hypothetical protein